MNVKKLLRYVVFAGLVALSATVSKGSWGHAVTTANTDYVTTIYVPSAAFVTQSGGIYSSATVVVNDGPLGYYQLRSSNPTLHVTGNIPGGFYVQIYQAVVYGPGYSATSITW